MVSAGSGKREGFEGPRQNFVAERAEEKGRVEGRCCGEGWEGQG